MPQFVYKVSEQHGITRFEPRPFWVLNSFTRSGSAADPARVPPGAQVVHGVYAGREAMAPFYFAPHPCPRFSVNPWGNEPCLPVLQRWFGPTRREASRVIVFRAADREEMARHEFSVYAFDARHFRPLPTGEFLADGPAAPAWEVRHRGTVSAIEDAGWDVQFVDGVEALRRLRSEVEAVGVTRFSTEKL